MLWKSPLLKCTNITARGMAKIDRWLLEKEVRDEFDSLSSPFDALKSQKIGPTFARIITRML